MHIEPIIPSEFTAITIRRTGGIRGMDQTVRVDRRLIADVRDERAGDRTFALDAWSAQELMTAVSTLVARRPSASSRQGCDLFHYDIAVESGGTVLHFSSVELGADEALHGVMLAANRLIDGSPEPIHTMSLHAQAPA